MQAFPCFDSSFFLEDVWIWWMIHIIINIKNNITAISLEPAWKCKIRERWGLDSNLSLTYGFPQMSRAIWDSEVFGTQRLNGSICWHLVIYMLRAIGQKIRVSKKREEKGKLKVCTLFNSEQCRNFPGLLRKLGRAGNQSKVWLNRSWWKIPCIPFSWHHDIIWLLDVIDW